MTNFDPTHKFYVGQDVACVDASTPQYAENVCPLEQDRVYKIRWLGVFKSYLAGEYLGIKVEGVENEFCGYDGPDKPFNASRFRPLVHDPLASLKNIAADPDGYKPVAPEAPMRGKPVREGAPKRKVKEEV